MRRLLAVVAASIALFALIATSSTVRTVSAEVPGKFTGNIGVVSQYVYRGIVESSEATVQGGFDYEHPSGFYAGYWGSGLGDTQYQPGAFESNVYVGYTGSAGPFNYDVGALRALYTNDGPNANNDANELSGSVEYGPASAGLTYATRDVSWTEDGDLFTTLSYGTTVQEELTVAGLVRFAKWDDPTASDGLAQIEVALSHSIGDLGADVNFRFIHNDSENVSGGADSQLVLGFKYGMDLLVPKSAPGRVSGD